MPRTEVIRQGLWRLVGSESSHPFSSSLRNRAQAFAIQVPLSHGLAIAAIKMGVLDEDQGLQQNTKYQLGNLFLLPPS